MAVDLSPLTLHEMGFEKVTIRSYKLAWFPEIIFLCEITKTATFFNLIHSRSAAGTTSWILSDVVEGR